MVSGARSNWSRPSTTGPAIRNHTFRRSPVQVGLIPIRGGSTDAAAPTARSRADGSGRRLARGRDHGACARTCAPYARALCSRRCRAAGRTAAAFIDDAVARGAAAVLSDPSLAGLTLAGAADPGRQPAPPPRADGSAPVRAPATLHRSGNGHQRQDLGRRLHPADLDRPRARPQARSARSGWMPAWCAGRAI